MRLFLLEDYGWKGLIANTNPKMFGQALKHFVERTRAHSFKEAFPEPHMREFCSTYYVLRSIRKENRVITISVSTMHGSEFEFVVGYFQYEEGIGNREMLSDQVYVGVASWPIEERGAFNMAMRCFERIVAGEEPGEPLLPHSGDPVEWLS